jgi:hypothetical protein
LAQPNMTGGGMLANMTGGNMTGGGALANMTGGG